MMIQRILESIVEHHRIAEVVRVAQVPEGPWLIKVLKVNPLIKAPVDLL